jgi:hypothetical protein
MTNATTARCSGQCGKTLPVDELGGCMTCDQLVCRHCDSSCSCEAEEAGMEFGMDAETIRGYMTGAQA